MIEFYRDGEYKFKKDIVNLIPKLKSKINKSGYYDNMLVFKIDENLPIIYENTELEFLSPEDWDKEIEEINKVEDDIASTIQFLTMTAKINDELYEKHNLKEKNYLVGMLRKLYIDHSKSYISMGYKRPFGNSNVHGDVTEIYYQAKLGEDFYNKMESYYDDKNDNYGLSYDDIEEIIKEFCFFLKDFLSGGFEIVCDEFKSKTGNLLRGRKYIENFEHVEYLKWCDDKLKSQIHTSLFSWNFSKRWYRNKKIEKVL